MARWIDKLEQFAVDVILERRYGKRATVFRWFLSFLSLIYNPLVRLRVWLYKKRLLRSYELGCLVISVGNLTVGGTGKTPLVEKLAKELSAAGRKVAILSRGYKSVPPPLGHRLMAKLKGSKEFNPRVVSDGEKIYLSPLHSGDEPYMLAKNLKGVAVITGKNRVQSGLWAIKNMNIDILILDDGFQYLPLKERLDIVLIDREFPFGNRHLLPRGMLREPKDHLKRADLLFITKCDGSNLSPLKEELRKFNNHAPIIECVHKPQYLFHIVTRKKEPLDYLKGLKVAAISGIAQPESFEKGLKKLGAEVVYSKYFADHHWFSEQEIIRFMERSKARNAKAAITTEKDAVRIPTTQYFILPFYFLRVEIEMLNGKETFQSILFESISPGRKYRIVYSRKRERSDRMTNSPTFAERCEKTSQGF
ncbi:tetraacyldisaccharide 4'-kinase [Candidatus Methylacidiphilum infernorum]|nr:tetraacyldisaccharide 4'-kinase [Candidatus Methylacidiphilum infernorum]